MHDPQDTSPQYLEDLATGYWRSEVLFTAVERGVFTLLEPDGRSVADLAGRLGWEIATMERFIGALSALGLVFEADGLCGNTTLARKYLVQGSESYQGESILWRKYLGGNWQTLDRCLAKGTRVLLQPAGEPETVVRERFRKYCRAMDVVAKTKIEEILPIFAGMNLAGDILDVGSGLGAFSAGFLKQHPGTRATLLDMAHVLEYAAESHAGRDYAGRLQYQAVNVLEAWSLPQTYGLIILSNIVHAFAEAETGRVLAEAAAHLAGDGLLLIHDFFMEHHREKAALTDLNMLVNTYNGKVYAVAWVMRQLAEAGLSTTELVPLETDTAVLVAVRHPVRLTGLRLGKVSQLSASIQALGFAEVRTIDPASVALPAWVEAKCRFGCDLYGAAHCPPYCLPPEKTRAMLADYAKGLLLQGVPPTRDFQLAVLRAEHLAFKAGYYKAFSLWAGPCGICPECSGAEACGNRKNARPSMEGSGIDVFETARRAGLSLRTLPEQDGYVKYFALLLLE